MKIRLLSDLHLEGRQGYSKVVAPWAEYKGEDVLVLAGDIAVGVDEVIKALIYFKTQGFPHIIYVPGNHEFYHGKFSDISELAVKIHNHLKDVHLLDANEIIKIKDVSFFGGTLWTEFHNDPLAEFTASRNVNDFRVIKGWSVADCIKEHRRQIDYIYAAYSITPGKKCIVTHFLPAMMCTPDRYKSDGVDILLNKYFANKLDNWISNISNTTWLFGHTHDATDFVLGETRLVSNPLGYAKEMIPESARFNPNKVIEI